ncbi:fluoride efflux transporter CrcB [Angustibacter sp. McL0619]|uniref:fluoride efflux transporter CrcB n=1 Tax=Angustibacter sp. McL0619 TaxID=3415676 RepID=UPI003CF7E187
MNLALVLAGGAVGAVLRYVVDQLVSARRRGPFPWGTFTVNAVGCLVLGTVAGAVRGTETGDWLLPLVGTGLCGGLTTFSTFSFETFRLAEDDQWWRAGANVLASLAVGSAATAVGYAVATGLWRS